MNLFFVGVQNDLKDWIHAKFAGREEYITQYFRGQRSTLFNAITEMQLQNVQLQSSFVAVFWVYDEAGRANFVKTDKIFSNTILTAYFIPIHSEIFRSIFLYMEIFRNGRFYSYNNAQNQQCQLEA